MSYFIDRDGNYPRHIGDVEQIIPGWVSGDVLPDGWQEVAAGVIPVTDPNKEVWFEIEPALVDGVMTRQFAVRALTKAELDVLAEQNRQLLG